MLLHIIWSFFETNSQPQFHSSRLPTLPRYSPCPGASSMLSGVKVIPLPDCARHVSAASMSTGRSRGGVGSTTELAWWLTQYSTHGTFQSSENQTASWQATGLILPTTKHYIVEDSNYFEFNSHSYSLISDNTMKSSELLKLSNVIFIQLHRTKLLILNCGSRKLLQS